MITPEPLVIQLARSYAADMDKHRDEIHRLSKLRHAALTEARRMGMSVIAIADALGISRQQVHRLLRERTDAS